MKPVKYPRTYHLPFSPGASSDDKIAPEEYLSELLKSRIVITEKMDGENTSSYTSHIHARSVDSKDHPSRSWVKAFHRSFSHLIPENMIICGENCYAKHSIHYQGLESYFLGFSVWIDDFCLPWDQTLEWFSFLGISPVPVIFSGYCSTNDIQTLVSKLDQTNTEGLVVRSFAGFSRSSFSKKVLKWVRSNHDIGQNQK